MSDPVVTLALALARAARALEDSGAYSAAEDARRALAAASPTPTTREDCIEVALRAARMIEAGHVEYAGTRVRCGTDELAALGAMVAAADEHQLAEVRDWWFDGVLDADGKRRREEQA